MRILRPARRALGAALASCALLALVPWTGAPARAEEAEDSSLASLLASANADEGLAVTIDEISPRILSDEDELLVSGEVRNTGGEALTNPAILLSMSPSTPISVEALADELSDGSAPGPMVAASNLGADLGAGESERFEIRVPVEQLPLGPSSAWGPRTISVTASSDGSSGFDRSIVIRDSGEEVQPTRVSVLVPWTSQNATGEASEKRVVAKIAATEGATLAIDSTVLPGPETAGGDEDEAALDLENLANESFVSELLTSTDEVVALPEGDADLGALALAGSSSLIERALASIEEVPSSPSAAGWVAEAGDGPASGAQSSTGSSAQSASSTAQSGAAEGSDASQSGAGVAADTLSVIRDVAWPSASSFGTTELSAFQDRVTIAPAGSLQPAEEIGFTSLALAEVDVSTGSTSTEGASDASATVLIPDEEIVALLDWAASSDGEELDAEQALSAVTAIITRERPNSSRTLFAATSRSTPPDSGLAERVSTLLSSRWVAPISFSDLAASEPTDVERSEVGAGSLDETSAKALSTLSSGLASLIPLAEATTAPDEVFASVSEGLLSAASAALDSDERLTRASQFSARVSDLRMQVRAEPSTAVNLINKSAEFPVRVRNDLDWDVEVTVTLIPSDPRLRVTEPTTARIAAGSVTTVEVPVTAIGSGDIEVDYRVSTPDGSVLSESAPVLVRMRAGWEDALTITAAGALGLLFVGGLVRTLRSRARESRDDTTDGE